jgi:hypothetical protein
MQDATLIEDEAAELTGRNRRWTAEPLVHNAKNAVTAEICRVSADGLSAALKVIAPPAGTAASPWEASVEPSH